MLPNKLRDYVSQQIFYPLLMPFHLPNFPAIVHRYHQKKAAHLWPRAQQLKEQERALEYLLATVYRSNPYYRECIANSGASKERNAREILSALPVLSKTDIQDNYADLTSGDLRPGTYWENSTGGSTGEPLVVLQDANFKFESIATTYVSDNMQGWDFGVRFARLWGAPKDNGPRMRWRGQIGAFLQNDILYDSFQMGEREMRRFHQSLSQYTPEVLLAYAGSAYLFAKFLKAEGIRPHYPTRAIITSAETLTETMRQEISTVFQAPVFNRYGSREAGNIASECSQRRGLHIHMLDYLVETVDPHTGESMIGRPGKIVLTLLTNYAMPLIRYEIGDIGVLGEEECDCGRRSILLKQVLGRTSDFIQSPSGALIHGEYFTHAFYGYKGIRQFQFIQESLDHYRVRIARGHAFNPGCLPQIENEIRRVLGTKAIVSFEFPEEILSTQSGKYRFTISKLPS